MNEGNDQKQKVNYSRCTVITCRYLGHILIKFKGWETWTGQTNERDYAVALQSEPVISSDQVAMKQLQLKQAVKLLAQLCGFVPPANEVSS